MVNVRESLALQSKLGEWKYDIFGVVNSCTRRKRRKTTCAVGRLIRVCSCYMTIPLIQHLPLFYEFSTMFLGFEVQSSVYWVSHMCRWRLSMAYTLQYQTRNRERYKPSSPCLYLLLGTGPSAPGALILPTSLLHATTSGKQASIL